MNDSIIAFIITLYTTMKRVVSNFIPAFIFVFALFASCETPQSYSNIPEISFKSIQLKKALDSLDNEVTRVILVMKVIDGDGDIGLPEDTLPLFMDLGNKNLFLKMYKKTDDGFVEIVTKFPYNYRTPYLEPEGQDKSLIADFEVTLDYTRGALPGDTIIKYDFYIYDRQKHMSNIGKTPEFPADTLGTISVQ